MKALLLSLSLLVSTLASAQSATNAFVRLKHPKSILLARVVVQDKESVTLDIGKGKTLKAYRTNILELTLTVKKPAPRVPPPAAQPTGVLQARATGLSSLGTPEGQATVAQVMSLMALNRSQGATDSYARTVSGLQDGTIDLKQVRDQAADMLSKLNEYSVEMNNDPNAKEWLQHQQALQDFVRRYDAGER